jgi:hypothetical protein
MSLVRGPQEQEKGLVVELLVSRSPHAREEAVAHNLRESGIPFEVFAEHAVFPGGADKQPRFRKKNRSLRLIHTSTMWDKVPNE